MDPRPAIRPDITEQVVGDELMLFDKRADKVHVLNPTSAYIWNCLKEGDNPPRIEERVREAFDTSGVADLPGLIQRALQQFAEKELFEAPGPAA